MFDSALDPCEKMEMIQNDTYLISIGECLKGFRCVSFSHQVNSSDSSISDDSDDEVTCRGRSDPVETRPILSIREYLAYL